MTPPHAGAWARGTQRSAWQHTAATQSSSLLQDAEALAPSFCATGAGADAADDGAAAVPVDSAEGRAHPATKTNAAKPRLRSTNATYRPWLITPRIDFVIRYKCETSKWSRGVIARPLPVRLTSV